MERKLIIDGNAVYELDEKCMMRKVQNEGDSDILRKENSRYFNSVREERNRME